nr:TlpA disulfide reductase family protein [Mesorhizobium jarvisii]
MHRNVVLQIDSPAPSIKVENWLRGEPLTTFEPGKVYIIEFWATWCGPCVDGMSHLMQLQEKYRDSGVEIVGVAASEAAPTADEARSKLDAWLTEKFSNLNYRMAFDSTGEMKKLWMEPSFSFTIPTSFVVDRDAHIAFIGGPTKLDEVLPKVLNGSWRASDQAKAADRERIEKGETHAREKALKKPIYDKLGPAMQTEDWKTALSAIEEGITLLPDNFDFRVTHAHLLLHKMRDMEAGLPVMRQFVRDAIDRESKHWIYYGLFLLFAPCFDYAGLPSAERFAMGEELSKHIVALPQGDGSKFMSYPMVAQYYHKSGNKDRAIELVEQALKALDGPEPISNDLKQHLLPQLLQALANYKGEKVCHGTICVAPQKDSPNVNGVAEEQT